MQATRLRIGTRGSELALAQAREVSERLKAAHGLAADAIEIVIIKTTGDTIVDRPLADIGGKGLFTKEIEEALLSKDIDLAVHSMKDMQTELPAGLALGAALPREDVRDAFISLKYPAIDALPQGGVIGTSSLRRQAQIKHLRPDLNVVGFRGNVQTRLRKLGEGAADATFLACAGLIRLGLKDRITAPVPTDIMLPAVAQGVIGLEIRAGDEAVRELVAPLNDPATAICVIAERAFLARLEGSCRTPIAGLAELDGDELRLRGQTLAPDGSRSVLSSGSGRPEAAAELGCTVAEDILARGGQVILGG